jgi:integrase
VKNQLVRETMIDDEYVFALTNWWLANLRPRHAEPYRGPVLPSSQRYGQRFTREHLTETTSSLIQHLIAKGLLHEQFTFHTTRKTWARHLMIRHDNDVALLLKYAGWGDTSQLRTYLALNPGEAESEALAFLRSLEAAA